MNSENTQKYQLAYHYQIVGKEYVEEIVSPEWEAVALGNAFILLDKASQTPLLINPDIAQFLNRFTQPVALQTVVEDIAAELSEPIKSVKKVIKPFFLDMVADGVLVKEKVYNTINQNLLTVLKAGTIIGNHYTLEKYLSLSPPVEIHKAVDSRTNRPVLLKILRKPTSISQYIWKNWRKEFAKEFKVQELLRGHQGICQLLEKGDDFAAIEWVEGKSLNRTLEQTPLPPLEKRLNWLHQLLGAFTFIHQKGVIHGDMHGSNVFISPDGNSLKIIDFDLACVANDNNLNSSYNGGSYEFIPPERVAADAFNISKQPPNFRSDVYQLGVLAYLIVYNKLPFESSTWSELGKKIVEEKPVFPKTTADGFEVNTLLIDILNKCLAKNPEERFADAGDMAATEKNIKAN